jgi:hypothetical protein
MTQPHDDPFDEAKQKALQSLGVLSTVGEAGARLAAVGMQQRAAEAENQAGRVQAAAAARREADKLAASVRADREKMAAGLDGTWLKRASFVEAAAVWRTATVHAAAGDPVAARVAGLALDRLGDLHPQWREAYDRHRTAGRNAATAAREAAYEVRDLVRTPPARAHGDNPDRAPLRAGANGRALPVGGAALDDLDAVVRAEAGRLMRGISPEALDQLQRELRAAGQAPAADGLGLTRQYVDTAVATGAMTPAAGTAIARELRAKADAERADARRAAGVGDDPKTVVDEQTVSQVIAHDRQEQAARDDTLAAQRQRWGSAFPRLSVSGVRASAATTAAPASPVAVRTSGRPR